MDIVPECNQSGFDFAAGGFHRVWSSNLLESQESAGSASADAAANAMAALTSSP